MISIFNWNKKKITLSNDPIVPLKVDMHSHLLPGIDDGSQSIEESIGLIKQFAELGYKKLITTPHFMSDYYKNSPDIVLSKLEELKMAVKNEGIAIELEAANEYYLDEVILDKLEKNERLLTFGQNYLLFETSFINPFSKLDYAIFLMQSNGYRPIMAHPERYVYFFENYEGILKLHEKGVKLQVNINSLSGYYSKSPKRIAERLIQDQKVSFLGSDCHGARHMESMLFTRELLHYQKALQQNLLNNSLL